MSCHVDLSFVVELLMRQRGTLVGVSGELIRRMETRT
jgi:hypothetical protein